MAQVELLNHLGELGILVTEEISQKLSGKTFLMLHVTLFFTKQL